MPISKQIDAKYTSNGRNGHCQQLNAINNKFYDIVSISADTPSEMSERDRIQFSPVFPTDVNIFNCLPDSVYKNASACVFLNHLKEAVYKYLELGKLENVSLPKLYVSDQTDSAVTIDWIFSYFRLFFSFDIDEGNAYGIVEIDNIRKKYFSNTQEIDMGNCKQLAEDLLRYVISRMNGY